MNEKIKYLVGQVSDNNDQLAFSELYRHYVPGLISFACSIVKDRQAAEEIVLDVFLKLWENRNALKAIEQLNKYIYVATRHTSISFLRKKNKFYYNDFDEDDLYTFHTPESGLISKQNIEDINKAIQSLPSKCRLIFRLVKEEKLKYSEVADLLGISVKTVEAQMAIANKRLVAILKKYCAEYTDSLPQKKIK